MHLCCYMTYAMLVCHMVHRTKSLVNNSQFHHLTLYPYTPVSAFLWSFCRRVGHGMFKTQARMNYLITPILPIKVSQHQNRFTNFWQALAIFLPFNGIVQYYITSDQSHCEQTLLPHPWHRLIGDHKVFAGTTQKSIAEFSDEVCFFPTIIKTVNTDVFVDERFSCSLR